MKPLSVVLFLAGAHALHACTACYGQSDSPMAQGMNWGIMTLLAVIGTVLSGIVTFFVYVGRRSATHGPMPAPESHSRER